MRTVMDTELIRTMLAESGLTQKQLSDLMGYEDQSAVSQLVNRKRCSLDKAVAALDKMGYKLVIRHGNADVCEVKTRWSVGKGT